MSERPMQKSIDVLCHAIKVAGEAALRLKAENDALQERVARAERVVQRVIEWNRKYPSSTIYSEGRIREIAKEMDAINAEAIDASLSAKEGGA